MSPMPELPATSYPTVFSGDVPRPIHSGAVHPIWSPAIAIVCVPWPAATHRRPFHATPYPVTLKIVFPCPVHAEASAE